MFSFTLSKLFISKEKITSSYLVFLTSNTLGFIFEVSEVMQTLAGSKHLREESSAREESTPSLLEEVPYPTPGVHAAPMATNNVPQADDISESESSSGDFSSSGFRKSRSSSISSSDSPAASSEEDDEALENFIQHVQVTANAIHKRERSSTNSSASQSREEHGALSSPSLVGESEGTKKKSLLPSQLLFRAANKVSSFPSLTNSNQGSLQRPNGSPSNPMVLSQKAKLEETLRTLREELMPTPGNGSTELTLFDPDSVVDAAEESAMVMERLVARKISALPPAEDVKKLRRLEPVDHSRIPYIEVQKIFYQYPYFTFSTQATPVAVSGMPTGSSCRTFHSLVKKMNFKGPENGIASDGPPVLSPGRWKAILQALDGAKVRGRNPPLPLLHPSSLSYSSSTNRSDIESSTGGRMQIGEAREDEGDGSSPLGLMDEKFRYSGSWDGTGLSDAVLEHLSSEGYKEPFAVQALAVPVLMSGRDLILSAKTGSGKTLGYVLPLVRHCIQQPRCGQGEGPIGLVLVPTQELAAQVFSVLDKLCKAAKLRTCTAYGCTSLTENIKLVKAGCDAMVATPGRILDLLTINHCTTLRLNRVSFVVVDEADRLFDSGFKEHVEAFLRNIRPDRQLAMVSATLPRELKRAMLAHMHDPIEISVGGRPTPASNVEQQFYFFEEEVYEIHMEEESQVESPRLLKLLQILGEECCERGRKNSSTKDRNIPGSRVEGTAGNQGLILIFTQRKEEVDELMAKLTTLGYDRCIATLYSGMDPVDRQFALENFNSENQFILIATAVAERGLDIPQLELVINYALPDHVEAYVHRIGRTGRAGKKGRAISFFRHGLDDDLAPELADALERSGQPVPEALYETSARVRELRRDGTSSYRVGFYRGYQKGRHHQMANRQQKEILREAAKDAGLEDFLSSDEDEDGTGRGALFANSDSDGDDAMTKEGIKMVSEKDLKDADRTTGALVVGQPPKYLSYGAKNMGRGQLLDAKERLSNALSFARDTTAVAAAQGGDSSISSIDGADKSLDDGASSVRFQMEYEINDLPNVVRGALQKGAFLRSIKEETSVSVVRKGIYVDPQRQRTHRLKEGDRPLYLLMIGKTPEGLRQARKLLDDAKAECLGRVQKKHSAVGAVL